MIEVLERFLKRSHCMVKVAFIDIEDDRATHSHSPLIFDCMSQNNKLIAIGTHFENLSYLSGTVLNHCIQ
jgi:hypothetical protein